MHFTSIIVFFLFACATSALPLLSNVKRGELSRNPSDIHATIKNYVEKRRHIIAEGGSSVQSKFLVYDDSIVFGKDHAVMKVISSSKDATREREMWAENGYLLAYATEALPELFRNYLFLKVETPVPALNEEEAQGLMMAARTSVPKSTIQYRHTAQGHNYINNFRWTHGGGKWHAKLFDWETGYQEKIGNGSPISQIPHVELKQA